MKTNTFIATFEYPKLYNIYSITLIIFIYLTISDTKIKLPESVGAGWGLGSGVNTGSIGSVPVKYGKTVLVELHPLELQSS